MCKEERGDNVMMMEKSNRRQDLEDILETRADGKLIHLEGQTLEFKENFNGMAEYLRDFAAFANNKGDYLGLGMKDRPRRAVGIKPASKDQFDKIDPEPDNRLPIGLFHRTYIVGA